MRVTLGYNPALDGLRALAVGAVIAEHAGFAIAGFYGVTVFFVISGYLITGLLLAERESSARIGLRAFYRRRWARLAPALSLVVGVTLLWVLAAGERVGSWLGGLIGSLTYSTDLIEVTSAREHISSYFEWSWSLAVEEQFYLIWPLVMIVLLSLGRRLGRWLLLASTVAVIAAAWVDRALMVASHAQPARVNFSFDTHMDAIAWGAVIAVAAAGRRAGPVTRRLAGAAALVGALGLWLVVGDRPVTGWLAADANGYGQVTLLCAALVAGVVLAPRGIVGRALSSPPLVHLGKLSYGLYLWNMLFVDVFIHIFGYLPAHRGAKTWIGLALLVGVAELSYRYVETPLRRRWAHRREPTPQAVAPAPAAALSSA
jgi:peptidoglycan/LPS O-acetylase OafA/YrhL